ncbi:TonB-dependent receptor family protein [Muricauda sp. CAU 1633]|uniref:TonB-dependent receptor domain-containing protein n=1 Tax=Allomuricauda sp. CAU 1633 TaxID=2816036 RepID=UPI001A8D8368|nr:TonB-dependent receptor [Muricauda sp. CAU 1633]MBO0322727.1 TonB-dependent receptor family protein [Muricauda sp. CAU 1633]
MKHIFWIFFTVGIVGNAQAQFSIKGEVFDANNHQISIGDVLLYSFNKEDMIKYTTLVEGNFEFEGVAQTSYWLEVSALGYKTHFQEIAISENLELSIQLLEEVTELESVEVVALKNPITSKNGNFKIDVQNPVFSSMVDPLEVLSKLPNVQISPERESISVIAKGNPLIYLGNQRISFDEFTALSVDTIESIELINNPSPKYEAEGRAVILIQLKKNTEKGTTVTLGETLSFRQNTNNYISTNGNHSNGKWNLRGNLNYNTIGQWESNTFAFAIPEENIYSDYLVLIPDNKRMQINSGFGFYYPIDDNDYISFNTIFRRQTDDAGFETETLLQNGSEINEITSETENDNRRDYFSSNFNFNKRLNPNLNLFTGIQYSTFKQKLHTDISNNYNNEGLALDQTRNQDYNIESLAARVDFEQTLSENSQLDFGVSWNEARADAFSQVIQPETFNEDITSYDYEESLYAIYVNTASQISGKFNLNVGARVEYNQVEGQLENHPQPLVERENTRIFPKMGLNFTIDSTKTLSLNYARNINRPNFSRTSSVRVFINPFLEAGNNVDLVPAISDEISTNLQIGNVSIFSGIYSRQNPRYFMIGYSENDTVALLAENNLDKESGFYTGLTIPFSHKSWSSTNSVSLNYNRIKDSSAVVTKAQPYLYIYTNQQLKVAKDTIVSVGGYALTSRKEGIIERNGMMVLNASVTTIFFEKLQCALRFNDITKAMNYDESYSINGVEANGTYYADGQEMVLSVKYSFGGNSANKFKNKDVDENLNRIN